MPCLKKHICIIHLRNNIQSDRTKETKVTIKDKSVQKVISLPPTIIYTQPVALSQVLPAKVLVPLIENYKCLRNVPKE